MIIIGGISLRTTNTSRVIILLSVLILLAISFNIGITSADEELVAFRGENVTISVVLLQNGTYGNPVPEQEIEFFDQTNNLLLGIDTTDSNGLVSIIWSIPADYSLGPTIVNATFRGNESIYLAPSYQSIILNILASTEIILHDVPTLLAPGDILSFSVSLLDDTSTPLTNRPLFVFSDDTLLAVSVTNSTGVAKFSIHCNSSWDTLGDNVIRIVHEQDLSNWYGRTETQFVVAIQQLQTSIQSNFSLEAIMLDDILSLEIELSSGEGGISTNLEILFDGNPFTVMNTDSFGNGILYLDINEQFSLGHHHLRILYNGSERYAETSLTLEFDITSPAFVDIMVPSSSIIGQISDISISLCDILGRPIEGMVTVSDLTSGHNSTIQIPQETIDFTVQLVISNPVGLHNLLLEIDNPYVTNSSTMQSIIIWSQPIITIQHTNILHFASLNQELTFTAHLGDWSGNASYRYVHLFCNDTMIASSITNEHGIAILSVVAPNHEGLYNLSIVYLMNTTQFELSTKLDYQLTVSTSIPLLIELDHYEVIPPLQYVSIFLRVQCLNGSLIKDIPIRIMWLSIDRYTISQQGGVLSMHLPIPHTSGNYSLYYEVDQKHSLAATSGTINISISLVDILTSQGIGINGFAIGIFTSFAIVAIPLIRRRYLMI
jgi:hypothetical protein